MDETYKDKGTSISQYLAVEGGGSNVKVDGSLGGIIEPHLVGREAFGEPKLRST